MDAVAFFSDSSMLPGLHVTIVSLLQSLRSNRELAIYLFADRISERQKQLLRKTHSRFQANTHLVIEDYTPQAIHGANLLHGNATAYGRLYLSDLLPKSDRCVYLDCDLIVNRDIDPLLNALEDRILLCCDGVGVRHASLDHELFAAAGLDLNGSCFNSGVLGINLKKWREDNAFGKCEVVASRYPGMFKSADQALLNVAFHDQFLALGDEFNTALYPSNPPVEQMESRIYHFVGSPKPWEGFAGGLTGNYRMWREFYRQTAIQGVPPWTYTGIGRTVRISGSVLRLVANRIRSRR